MPDNKEKKDEELSYKERNGTTRVGDFLRKAKSVAPDVLRLAGNVTGVDSLKNLGNAIDKDDSMDPVDKKIALAKLENDIREEELLYKFRAEKEKAVTKRWQADMQSDNKASKNIRPYTLGYLLVITTILILLDSAISNFNVKAHWVELLSTLVITAVGGYFVLRTTEKPGKIRSGLSAMKSGVKNAFIKKSN